MKKTCKLVYVIICLMIMLLPFAGMIFFKTDKTTENKTLAEMPDIVTDGKINIEYLSQLGIYFEDRFAFRNYMVDADSNIQAGIFKTSNVKSVIVGDDGWLYYASTLDNYLSRNGLSSRGVFNAVHNMKLMQNYVEQNGAKFLLTIAPNKNSLYGENMPYYCSYNAGETENIQYVTAELKKQEVNYVDLFEKFRASDKVLYLKRDSHWNNEGALLAYNSIMDALEQPHERYETVNAVRTKDYIGDLNRMIYPVTSRPEWNVEYQYDKSFTYVGSDNVEDSHVETMNTEKNGTLLMFRDSFGNTLIPFMSDEFEKCFYSKAVPYNIESYMSEYKPDTVVVEKVERNIEEFASRPAVFENPTAEEIELSDLPDGANNDVNEDATHDICIKTADANSSFIEISGTIDNELPERDSLIYVEIENNNKSVLYEAFTISDEKGDNGYLVYLGKDKIEGENLDITVYVANKNDILFECNERFDMKTLQ
ncbi:MAG: hypothetical protein ACI4EF_08940 [Coprococcus sp.]